jgi:putative nucleotidyltransferase with HDIG domain
MIHLRGSASFSDIVAKIVEKLTMSSTRGLNGFRNGRSLHHPERVADYAVRIGRAMGLDANDIRILKRGGMLHDIGKIGTPLTILNKTSKLSEDEFSEVKCHPETGVKILEQIEVHPGILGIVLQHHERYDGHGYPFGLAGSDISLHGRITAVADVYDALSSARPYRIQWDKDRVISYILGHAGTHFDPAVVEAFELILDKIPAVPGPARHLSFA